jgi:hypothetical protein
MEAWGWNCPALTRHDLADMAETIAAELGNIPKKNIDETLEARLDEIPDRITKFRNTTLQYLFNGNAQGAFPVYNGLLNWCYLQFAYALAPDLDWTTADVQRQMPRGLLRRIRSVDSQLTDMESRTGGLNDKIKVIEEAHEAAEALPTDLASLNEARDQIGKNAEQAEIYEKQSKKHADDSKEILQELAGRHNEAEKIVSSLEDAYSAATTKGLGESFAERAKKLADSMWVWVGVLIVSLASGAVLSLIRLAALKKVLETETPNLGLVWVNIILGVLSIAGPVWLAWVATKQIGQRFRLSEDYAFKASVAKAYEGYRREAARVDEKFAKELFASALARLDEAPLRYVEHETYGSPWHEMTATKAGQRPSILANVIDHARKPKRAKSESSSADSEDAK